MKLNIRNACAIGACVVLAMFIINPMYLDPGKNLMFAAAISIAIYLIGVLIYYATGQLALMCEARPAVETIMVYNDVVPINGEVLFYSEKLGCFEFLFHDTQTGLIMPMLIKDTDKEEIDVHQDNKCGISITETRYTWANGGWQFFGNCPKISAWEIYLGTDYQQDNEEEAL